MLSLEGLLNPAPTSEEDAPPFPQPSRTPDFPSALNIAGPSKLPRGRTLPSGHEDNSNMARSKLRGQVLFPPFENLNEVALQEIDSFRVSPFGHIQRTCSHIPYNSGKKDFYEKTGRDSFEIFKYEFTLPGESTEYSVMWDYNIGLVRMTPFFKCRGYGKASGSEDIGECLKEITHSITGGSIVAQGYWMPYQCARAICATFCYPIAGALVPIFGPTFPSTCIPPNSPDFGRMIIDPRLISDATREAEITRRMHVTMGASSFHSTTSFPREDRPHPQGTYFQEERRRQYRPRLVCDPAWATESDADQPYMSAPNSASSTGSGLPGYMVTSRPGSVWTSANQRSPEPNPWLSAVPRDPPSQQESALLTSAWGPKRRLDDEDWGSNYRGSASPAVTTTSIAMTPEASPMTERVFKVPTSGADMAQKNAAMLLLNLSMQDHVPSTSIPADVAYTATIEDPCPKDEHRSKRHRASPF
ncbi:apses transcription factor xbp1 [Fusarium heterosporum]|uniref:Apses transcription factor xbp1 n=1 Tax=Fusarium heterosporum TaxID=42747 RepID=A0A8H5WUX5_FUSHE|nr:apses transcription factor xbp1 [Fusarium heterosporum]